MTSIFRLLAISSNASFFNTKKTKVLDLFSADNLLITKNTNLLSDSSHYLFADLIPKKGLLHLTMLPSLINKLLNRHSYLY